MRCIFEVRVVGNFADEEGEGREMVGCCILDRRIVFLR